MNKISQLLKLKTRPLIMGVLNLTPDSFSDGGKYNEIDLALKRVEYMIESGADIIDIGAESSRPGAEIITVDDERERLEPTLKEIKKVFDVPISIDTYKPEIMKLSIDYGVDMINDIYALQKSGTIEVISNSNVLVCLMHMQNSPKNMQNSPHYKNIILEVESFFKARTVALNRAGIKNERILLDPGFGFGKTFEHNIDLFKKIKQFTELSFPLLVGVSRKSMVKKMVGNIENDIIQASVLLACLAVQNGAKILRVHDVKETFNAISVLQAV
jgi:dihydropteroate synthase